jgi:transcriptional regulator with XRE-family HTH domain
MAIAITKQALIDFAKITINPDICTNPRGPEAMEPKNIGGLQDNIEHEGLLTPLTIAKVGKEYILVSGFRRHAAITLIRDGKVVNDGTKFADLFAGGKIPVVIISEVDDVLQTKQNIAIYNLVENMQRKDLEPYELSQAIMQICGKNTEKGELGLSQSEAARRIGISQAYVSMLYNINLKASAKVFAAFAEGTLEVKQAVDLVKLSEEEQDAKIGAIEELDDDEVEIEEEDGVPKRGSGLPKAQVMKQKKAEAASVLDADNAKPKFVYSATKVAKMVASIEKHGINPMHSKDSYIDGVLAMGKALLGMEVFPFDITEPEPEEKPKKAKKGKKAAEVLDDEEEEVEEELDDDEELDVDD